MTGPIFDTHAHYSSRAFDADRIALLDSLPDKGVVGVCEQATHSGDAPRVLELAHRMGFVPVPNRHPDWGISHTISLGLGKLPEMDAALFQVADQPRLQKETVADLIGFAAAVVQTAQGDRELFSRVLTGLFDTAKAGFDISLGLVGIMSFWLGVMKVGEKLYAAQQAQEAPAQGQPQGEKTVDGDVVDAEFTEVEKDKKQ